MKITDKQRLDWLTRNRPDLTPLSNCWHVDSTVPEFTSGHIGKSPSAAIDAAIRAEKRRGK